jgi:hypothetical protein
LSLKSYFSLQNNSKGLELLHVTFELITHILGDKGPKLVENDLKEPFNVLEIIIHGVVNARLRGLNKLLVLCGECFKIKMTNKR